MAAAFCKRGTRHFPKVAWLVTGEKNQNYKIYETTKRNPHALTIRVPRFVHFEGTILSKITTCINMASSFAAKQENHQP